MSRYELHYWPTIQGRGEFIRLAREYAGVEYIDVARQDEAEGGSEEALLRSMERADVRRPPFAPRSSTAFRHTSARVLGCARAWQGMVGRGAHNETLRIDVRPFRGSHSYRIGVRRCPCAAAVRRRQARPQRLCRAGSGQRQDRDAGNRRLGRGARAGGKASCAYVCRTVGKVGWAQTT